MKYVPLFAIPILSVACCYVTPAMDPVATIETPTEVPDYNRKEWGRWIDADKDCQDARQEVLIAESLDAPTLDERGCKVLLGRWECPYTGKLITNPRVLDIDHVVPLREAHYSGGHAWNKAHKLAFFNDLGDPGRLIAVDRSANRSKGSKQPHEWLPPNTVFRCEYLRAWVDAKSAWDLETDCEEARGLAELMAEYCR